MKRIDVRRANEGYIPPSTGQTHWRAALASDNVVPTVSFSDVPPGTRGMPMALLAHGTIRVFGLIILVVFGKIYRTSAYEHLIHWDSGWYRDIATHGYGSTRVVPDGRSLSDYAFFPLYPALERAVSELTGLRILDSGILISAVASIVAAGGIYAIGRQVFDERVALVLVVLWSALPIAIVQSMAYTESLVTALSAWALYSILRGRFIAAGVLASLAGLTRPIGGAVVLAVVLSAVVELHSGPGQAHTDSDASSRWCLPVILGALIAPIGMGAYLGWVAIRRGSPLGYFDVAREWGNGLDGGMSFLAWVGDMLTGSKALFGLLICAGLGLLLWAIITIIQQRYPLCVVVFAVTCVLIALATSGYYGSKPRYLLPDFPLLAPLAVFLARTKTTVATSVLSLCIVTGSVYGAIWLYGPGPP